MLKRSLPVILSLLLSTQLLAADEIETSTEHLAKQLQNPVATLVSVPFQNNFEYGLGAAENGTRYTLKFQPVIPKPFNSDWNLVTRPIITYLNQQNVFGATSQAGLGDAQLQLFFSPKAPRSDGLIWGIGPVFLLPLAGDPLLGTEKWGIGPSAVCLKQSGGWTTGILANHLWSVAGNSARNNISLTYLQPFASHSSKMGTTFAFSSESSYSWLNGQTTIPLICGVSQILPIYGQLTSFGVSGIYHLQSPTNISKWGARATITLLFPHNNKGGN